MNAEVLQNPKPKIQKGEAFLFWKAVVAINALTPLGLLLLDAYRGNLGADPVQYFLSSVGSLALIFMMLTLAATPLRRILKRNELIKFRRMLGLLAFFYAAMHFVTYSVFDKGFVFADIVADVVKRPFITFGMAAFLMMVPLAVTSTNGWIKRIGGKRWALLHKLTYVIAGFGVVHHWMLEKSDIAAPLGFAVVFVGLMALRKR